MLKKIDHRILNKQLNLYYIKKKSPGIIFWLPNGFIVISNLKKFLRKIFNKYNYLEVQSAFLINKKIWEKSGHWKNYKKSIFSTLTNNEKLCIKPMNCPGHIEIYNQKIRSYKNLPIRFSEFGICHRNEKSGSLHGLMRTKSFIQDDAHIFCRKSQIKNEISKCIDMIYKIYEILNFKKIEIFLSTKPKNYIGKTKIWEKSENFLLNILKDKNIKFKINKKEGAFYGPKIEFILNDNLNRKWQCGTIQLDFNLPKKFNIFYINKKNQRKKPIIIHRAVLGSLERFIGILLESNNGWLPLWLTPFQTIVLNISEKYIKYSKIIFKILKKNNIRTIKDFENKDINIKIKKYTLQKIPYIIICGYEEEKSNKISVRTTLNNKTKTTYIENFIKEIKLKKPKF